MQIYTVKGRRDSARKKITDIYVSRNYPFKSPHPALLLLPSNRLRSINPMNHNSRLTIDYSFHS